MNRLEQVLFVGIVKPLAWVLLWAWWAICCVGRGVVHVGSWARQRWSRWRECRHPARQVRHKVAA